NDIYELTVASPTGQTETIRSTGFHKFYRPTDKAWVSAKELRPNDELNGATGPLVVRRVSKLAGAQRVYNMTVEDDHVYRVSLLGALVHNTGCNIDDHHLMTNKNRISEAAGGPYTQKFEALAKRRGITLKDPANIAELEGHVGPHPEYNAEVYRRMSNAT